jgi:HPt (histidine-containing phosphotransfer) domain-containing protein
MTWFYIEKFANITPQTSSELLKQFIVSLSEYFEMSGLKDMHQLDMSAETELLSNQLLKKFLQIQNKEKGST